MKHQKYCILAEEKMIQLLHIETSTKVCSVAISENGRLIDVLEESADQYIHGEALTIFIEKICKRNSLELSQLNGISVTGGPGSYTGLRIGASTAKGLCYALKLPLISVDSLSSIAYLAQKKYPNMNICAMIDARRMEVFSTIYNSALKVIKPLSADVLEDDTYAAFTPFIACGDGAHKTKEIWSQRDITIADSILSSAAGQVQIAHQKYINNEFEDVAYFEPKYLKDFIVTPSKKKPI